MIRNLLKGNRPGKRPLHVTYVCFNAPIRAEMRHKWDAWSAGVVTPPNPTDEGDRFIDTVLNGTGPVTLQAYAGTGKTTNILLALMALKRAGRLDSLAIHTYHSLGHGLSSAMFGRRVEVPKTSLFQTWCRANQPCLSYRSSRSAERLGDICKLTLSMPTNQVLTELVDKYQIDVQAEFQHDAFRAVREWIEWSMLPKEQYTFSDMIWWPAVHNLAYKTDLLFIDEAQDTDPAQMAIVQAAAKGGARVVVVGDRYQAIYEWRGASSNAMDLLDKGLGGTEKLALSKTFRCPVAVVDRVAYPILSKLGASNRYTSEKLGGTVEVRNQVEEAVVGDHVLCRTNAPLLRLGYKLLAERKRVMVRGRQFGEGLVSFVGRVTEYGRKTGEGTFEGALRGYGAQERMRLLGEEVNENRLNALEDKLECMQALSGQGALEEEGGKLIQVIEELFPQDESTHGRVVLSSVHRSKGTEAPRVWVLEPGQMPWRKTKKSGNRVVHLPPAQQEYHLCYVAATRAMESLVFGGTCTWSGREEREKEQGNGQRDEVGRE